MRIVQLLVVALTCGSTNLVAQRQAAPPASPTPSARIVVAAVRIVGFGLGANGSELRPFNEPPGTTVALAIQAPSGTGIVEIDDDASRIDHFADDKGQNLLEEGRIGPFPKVSSDGSAALFEVHVHGRPSAGAASVAAQGSVAVMLANGSKPQRIPNVRLEAARTMRLGTATITVKGATANDDSTEITLGLTRTLMKTIRGVKFFDAAGAEIESHRTGSGYINEAAELELTMKSKEKTVAVEFDVWQNLRQVQLPYNVTASLNLPSVGQPATASAPTAAAGRQASPPASPKPSTPTIMPGPTEGAASVDAVVKQLQTAAAAGNGKDMLAVIYPDDRATFAQAIAMTVTFSLMSHMNDQKAGEKAQKDLDALFAKHKIKPPLSREPAEIFKGVDLAAFVTDGLAFLKGQLSKGDDPADAMPVPKGKPQDLKVTGNSATAKFGGGKDVNFTQINGKWFIRLE